MANGIAQDRFKTLRRVTKLMDAQFRVPGTSIRFGLDAVIGLVPGAGDFAGFIISSMMLSVLAKNGASGFVLARMVVNVLIDALFGSIPLLGDIFDVAFKANEKNLKLMEQHYVEGRHQGSAWKVIVPILILLMIVLGCITWLAIKLFSTFFSWISG